MEKSITHHYAHGESGKLRDQLLYYMGDLPDAILLDSNTAADPPVPVTGIRYDFLGGTGVADEISSDTHSLDDLQRFIETHREKQNFVFGYLSYDLKNEFEKLTSSKPDHLQFPLWRFFVPEKLFIASGGTLDIRTTNDDAPAVLDQILRATAFPGNGKPGIIKNLPVKERYLQNIHHILRHIQRGDIYEMNYCEEVLIENATAHPQSIYEKLTRISPNPFSAFYTHGPHALACASPERFITRSGYSLISQPMKGTMPRSADPVQDEANRVALSVSEKDRSENVMITDLVRNDLSRIAQRGTVSVPELFGVYSFRRSHQMITTVSCEVMDDISFTGIIKALFPMGSMTGAPKIRAMELIEKYEQFRRGLFSGSIGYIAPNGDFDFNVVIRSILFNRDLGTVTVPAGGAITAGCIPEKEFEEMMLKLEPQLKTLDII